MVLAPTGCIFGQGGAPSTIDMADRDNDIGVQDDVAVVADSGPADDRDVGSADDDATMSDAASQDTGMARRWAAPEMRQRVVVSWNESAGNWQAALDVVVPLEIPGAGGDVVVRTLGIMSQRLAAAVDGDTVWVRLPTFGEVGAFAVYYDGTPAEPSENPWQQFSAVYHFNPSDPNADASGNEQDLISPAPGTTTGVVGTGALMPDGDSDGLQPKLESPLNTTLLSGSFLVEFWFDGSPNQTGGEAAENLLLSTDSSLRVHAAFAGPDMLQWSLLDALRDEHSGPFYEQFMPGTSNHLLVSYDSLTDTVRVVVNGKPSEVTGLIDWTPANQTFAIGSTWMGGGWIDEFRVSDRPRGTNYARAVYRSHLGMFEYTTPEPRD